MKPNPSYEPQLAEYFKLFKLLNHERFNSSGTFYFNNSDGEKIRAAINYVDDKEVLELLLANGTQFLEVTGEREEKTKNDLLQISKEGLKEKRAAFLSTRETFSKLRKIKDFPEALSLEEDGTLIGAESNKEAFSNEITEYVNDEKVRIIHSLNKALRSSKKDIVRLQKEDLLDNLEENYYHLSKCDKRNVGEYLEYLQYIGLLDEEDTKFINSKYSDLRDNKTFFDIFLSEFHKDLCKTSYAFDHKKHKDCSLNLISLKSEEEALVKILLSGQTDKDKIEARCLEDKKGIHHVGSAEVHYAETVGANLKRKQEDSFIIAEGNNLNSSKIAEKFDKLASPIKTKQEEFYEEYVSTKKEELAEKFFSGSTALLANYSTNKTLTLANCGDSRASIFVLDGDNTIRSCRPLTLDHKPDDFLEKKRIEKSGGKIQNSRVSGTLAVARSFGDSSYKGKYGEYLISSEPDIYEYDVNTTLTEAKSKYGEGSRIILVMSCDGLYENDLSEKSYVTALNKWFKNESDIQDKWQKNVAEYIQDCALCFKSGDNITVCVLDLTHAQDKDVLIGIFDGHGGKLISQTMAVECAQSLAKQNECLFVSVDGNTTSILENELKRSHTEETEIVSCSSTEVDSSQEIETNKKRRIESPGTVVENPELVETNKKQKLSHG